MSTDATPATLQHSATSLAGLQRAFRWGDAGVSSPERAFSLPVGTVTFLLTDVEGSTRMWSTQPSETMRSAIARHYEIISEQVAAHGGIRPQEQGEGDSIVAAFARPSDALRAALNAQLALRAEPWPTSAPILVRMAIHTGEAELRDGANYAGQSIIRTARLRAIAHGGQILVSGAARDLAVDQLGAAGDLQLQPLGEHRLRDLGRAEQVWQLTHPGLPGDFAPLRSIDAVAHNLPVNVSPFIGRVAEIETLAGLVMRDRLVTATGSGGAGKTRLAQQVAAELIDRFVGGVWWVELAPVSPDGVDAALRQTFGISEASMSPVALSIQGILDGRPGLIVLDNCEHVEEAIRPLADSLLRTCSSLHVLATSRVTLDVPGEVSWHVPPLSLPEPGASTTVDALAHFDAVRLFVDRAKRARPSFRLDDDNGPAVAELCLRLDGIPLAIELAAARCRMLAPQQILDGMHDAFRLLAGGSRTLMPRQQTIEASIAWSHDLLVDAERALFRRVAVFRDGWSLEAAEGICEGADLDALAVFDALDRLVSHSLVRADEERDPDGAQRTRFRMLETVRQFAAHQLGLDPAERASVVDRHAEWFREWMKDLTPGLATAALDSLIGRVTGDRQNLVAATDHLLATTRLDGVADMVEALHHPITDGGWHQHLRWLIEVVERASSGATASQCARMLGPAYDAALGLGDFLAAHRIAIEWRAATEADPNTEFGVIARTALLITTAVIGQPVIDEAVALAVGPVMEANSHDWRMWAAVMTMNTAVWAGRPDLVARLDERIAVLDVQQMVPARQGARSMARGLARLLTGDPLVAAAELRPTVALHRQWGTSLPAASFLACAAGDASTDDLGMAIEHLRYLAQIEANPGAQNLICGALGIGALRADDLDGARAHFDELTIRSRAMGIAGSFANERYVVSAAGPDSEPMDPPSEGSVTWAISSAHRSQAEHHLRSGRVSDALGAAHQALAIEAPLGIWRSGVSSIDCIARVLLADGRPEPATRLLAAADAFRTARHLVPYPCIRRLLDRAADNARSALGEAAFDAAWAEGYALSIDDAAAYASRHRHAHVEAVSGLASLTPTERKVAELVADGLTNREVGARLLMSPDTVKTHLSAVFRKLGVRNRQAVVMELSRVDRG